MKMLSKTALALLISSQLIACQPDVELDSGLQKAQAAKEAGNLEEAQIVLKNVVEAHPESAEARKALGMMLMEIGLYESAEKELRKAQQFGDQSNETALALLRSQLKAGMYDEVAKFDVAQNGLSNAQISEALMYQGLAALQQGDDAQAGEFLRQASDSAVDSEYGLLSRAYVESTQAQWDSAIRTLETITEQNPDFAEAYLLLGQLYGQNRENDKAVDAFSRYAELKPLSQQAQLYLADSLIKAHDFERAKPMLQTLAKSYPEHPFVNQLRAMVAFSEQDYDKAKTWSEKTLQQTNRNNVALAINGISNYKLERYEQAYRSLKAVAPNLPASHPARKLLVLTQLRLGYNNEISAELANTQFTEDDFTILSQSGLAMARSGDAKGAQKALDIINSFPALSSEEKTQKGILKLALDNDSGIEDLMSALEQDPSSESARQALISRYVEEGDNDALLKLADEMIKEGKDKVLAYNIRANAFLDSDPQKAKEALKSAQEIDPLNPPSVMYFSSQEAKAGNLEQASSMLEPLIKEKPKYIPAIQAYYQYQSKLGQTDKAVALLKTTAEDSGSPESILLYAQALQLEGKYDEVVKTLETVPENARKSDLFWIMAAEASFASDEQKQAYDFLRSWTKAQPKNQRAYLSKAAYHLNDNQINEALTTLGSGLAENPDSSALKLLEVQVLIQAKKFTLAKSKLDKVPDNENTRNTKQAFATYLLLPQNKIDRQSIVTLEKFYEDRPSPFSLNGVMWGYRQLKDKDGLAAFLKKAIANNPGNTYARKFYAELLIQSDPQEAIKNFELVVTRDPNDILSLNNLALLYLNNNQIDNAKVTINKALDVRKDIPFVLETAGAVKNAQGDKKAAADYYGKAFAIQQTPSITLNYAESLLALGKKKDAANALSQLPEKIPSRFQQRAESLKAQAN